MLGAGRVRTFVHVTLPVLLPAIASSAALAFAFCFTSFGVVLVLGGPQFATLEVAVYELTAKLLRLELAAALAIVQMVFTYLFLLVYARFQQNVTTPVSMVPQDATARRPRRIGEMVFVAAMVALLLVVLSPLWALVERALDTGSGYSFTYFASLFSDQRGDYFYLPLPNIIGNSLRFAVMTTAIALTVGSAAAYFISRPGRRGASVGDALLMMPLGVSAVIMGFGFLVGFNRDPFDLRATSLILIIAHSLVAYPFVIRSVLPAMRGMPQQLREAASVMGASPVRGFFPCRAAHPDAGADSGRDLRLRGVDGRVRRVAAAGARGVDDDAHRHLPHDLAAGRGEPGPRPRHEHGAHAGGGPRVCRHRAL